MGEVWLTRVGIVGDADWDARYEAHAVYADETAVSLEGNRRGDG